jgi:hypothetical protein
MEPVSDLLGDQGGVAAIAVVDDEVDPDLVFYGLVYEFSRVLDHLRIQHVADHFVKKECLGKGFLVAHPPLPSPWPTASAAAAATTSLPPQESRADLTPSLEILPFDERAARFYGEIRAHLEKRERSIGAMDLLIASHAISLSVPLVTNDIRGFKGITGLQLENWI